MDFRLWLMAGNCVGYDDDAQISCEHGGEEGGGRMFPYKYVAVFSEQLRRTEQG